MGRWPELLGVDARHDDEVTPVQRADCHAVAAGDPWTKFDALLGILHTAIEVPTNGPNKSQALRCCKGRPLVHRVEQRLAEDLAPVHVRCKGDFNWAPHPPRRVRIRPRRAEPCVDARALPSV